MLYGPPASGKDTITAALLRLSSAYVLFHKLKVGAEDSDSYRIATCDDIKQLRSAALVIYENARYGNIYVVDRPELAALLDRGFIPVLHMGQLAGVRAVRRYPADWLSVLLWCSRDSAVERLRERGADDAAARLAAWDETLVELSQSPSGFDLRIDTDTVKAKTAADLIHAQLSRA